MVKFLEYLGLEEKGPQEKANAVRCAQHAMGSSPFEVFPEVIGRKMLMSWTRDCKIPKESHSWVHALAISWIENTKVKI